MYIIGMNFISWAMAIWMLMGYGFIKSCETDVNNPMIDDKTKDNTEMFIQDYNSRNFAGRVTLTLTLGARMMALPFKKGD